MNKADYTAVLKSLDFSIQRNYWRRHMLGDLLLISLVAAFSLGGGLFAVLAPLPLTLIYFRAFAAMHDAVHGALHPVRAVNQRLGLFYGIVCFLPYSQWRQGHLDHHHWAGNIDKDPVMKLCRHVKDGGKISPAVELGWKLWLPVLAILQQWVFWSLSFQLAFAKNRPFIDRLSVVAPIVFWASIMAVAGVGLTCTLIVPSVVLYLVVLEAVNFPHHLDLPQYESDTKLLPREQHAISRSCTYFRWFEKNVLLNFNYHVEHHMFPTLPWHRLHEAHALVGAQLGGEHNAETGFHWVVRNRRRKLAEVLYAGGGDFRPLSSPSARPDSNPAYLPKDFPPPIEHVRRDCA